MGRLFATLLVRRDDAFSPPREMMTLPCKTGPENLRFDPFWRRVEDDPRFEEFMKLAKPQQPGRFPLIPSGNMRFDPVSVRHNPWDKPRCPHEHTLSCHRGDARNRSFIVGERPDAGKAEGRDPVARREYRGDLSGCGALLRFRCSNLPRFLVTLRIPLAVTCRRRVPT